MGKVKKHKGLFIEEHTGDSGHGNRQDIGDNTSMAGSSQGDQKPSMRAVGLYEQRTLYREDMRDSGC